MYSKNIRNNIKIMWFVYMIECSDNTIYTGVTTDIERRLSEHNHSNKGAKYTRTRRPVKLLKTFEFETRQMACKEEYRIKQLTKKEKLKLINE